MKRRREELKRRMQEKQKECAVRRKEEEARGGASFNENPISKLKQKTRNEAVLVDSTILKILGRTPKSKVTSKGIETRGRRRLLLLQRKNLFQFCERSSTRKCRKGRRSQSCRLPNP